IWVGSCHDTRVDGLTPSAWSPAAVASARVWYSANVNDCSDSSTARSASGDAAARASISDQSVIGSPAAVALAFTACCAPRHDDVSRPRRLRVRARAVHVDAARLLALRAR